MCLFNPCRIWEDPSRRWLRPPPFICRYCVWRNDTAHAEKTTRRFVYTEMFRSHHFDLIFFNSTSVCRWLRDSVRGLRTHQQDELIALDENPEQRLQAGNTSPLSAEPGSHVRTRRLRSSRPMFGEFKRSHSTTYISLWRLSSSYLSHFFKLDA